MNYINFKDVNLNLLQFGKIHKRHNFKYSLINCNNKPLRFSFVATQYKDCYYNDKKNMYVLKFSFNDPPFHVFLHKMFELIKKFVVQHKTEIFNQSFSDETIGDLFFSNLEQTHNNNKIISFKSKTINIFENKNLNKTNIHLLIEISGIWIYENLYGLNFELIQIL